MLKTLPNLTKFLFILFSWDCLRSIAGKEIVTNEYVLQLDPENLRFVEDVGRKFNLKLKRKLLNDTFLFLKDDEPAKSEKGNYTWKMDDFQAAVGNKVTLIEQQILRMFSQPQVQKANAVIGNDDQWIPYPDKKCRDYYGMGIEDVWTQNYQGRNLTVAIVDIGVEMNHKDLYININTNLSYNYVDDNYDANPPDHTNYKERIDIEHGSKCAGLVASEKNNEFCSAGVAPKAGLASIRWMDENGDSTDARLVSALRHKSSAIDVYSSSWALPDEPFVVVGTYYIRALLEGVEKGRNCKGSIFVFPAGNYISDGNCNTDGYVNTIYGITISSVGINGTKPVYDPVCACALASTFGEGSTMTSNFLITTGRNNSCTSSFHRTSASAALASGIIALTLEANPFLTWRDVQHILVETASFNELESSKDWRMVNGVGRQVSPYFGFGLMNAAAMVSIAKTWSLVGPKFICRTMFSGMGDTRNASQEFVEVTWRKWTNGCNGTDSHITTLEHVQVNITLDRSNFSGIEIYLQSAMSADRLSSPLLTRTKIPDLYNTVSWVFSTVHFWGENPTGIWILVIKHASDSAENTRLVKAELILHGTNSKLPWSEKMNCTDDNTASEKLTSATGNEINNTTNRNEISGMSLIVILLISILIFLLICCPLVIVAYKTNKLQHLSQCVQSLWRRMRSHERADFRFSRLGKDEQQQEDAA